MWAYSESPRKGLFGTLGSACCTDGMFEIFVSFGRYLCCLLPDFVNRQSPCLCTNSRHVLLHPQMHRRSLWFAKEHAPGVKSGRRLVAWPPPTPQKGLVHADHSNLHATTRNSRFYPLLRSLLLQHSFWRKSLGLYRTDFKMHTHTPPEMTTLASGQRLRKPCRNANLLCVGTFWMSQRDRASAKWR